MERWSSSWIRTFRALITGMADIPTTIARLNVPYGDGFGWPLLHLLMMQSHQPIPIHPDGSRYNPIHIDDMVAQIPSLLDEATTDATVLNWSGDAVEDPASPVTTVPASSGWPSAITRTGRLLPQQPPT